MKSSAKNSPVNLLIKCCSMGSSALLTQMVNDEGPLILDGGLATDLEAHGAKLQVNHKNNLQQVTIFY